jgi:rhamnogalacturonan endolyase
MALNAGPVAHGQLRFEAEEYSTPRDAWLKDKASPDRWMLWSTDRDAEKKWSGGVVLRSPPVMADRAAPEEGAPPLHTVLTGIPKGVYNVQIKSGRVLAVSLDGTNWSRYTGGLLARRVAIDNGTFELWVDDRFAVENEEGRGSAYYDCIFLHRCAPIVSGVPNGDFELEGEGDGAGLPLGWTFSSREKIGAASLDHADWHSGRLAARVEFDGEADWTFACSEALPVNPGDELALSAWVKGTVAGAAAVQVAGFHEGRLVARLVGRAGVDGGQEWTQTKGHFIVPEPVTELRLSLTGAGPADVRIDDVALTAEPMVWPANPKVEGWAGQRVEEKLDRGVVAARVPEGVYVGWRLLESDPDNVGFNVFRQAGDGPWVKLTGEPIVQTTDFVDRQAPEEAGLTYKVEATAADVPFPAGTAAPVPLAADGASYVSIKLQDAETRFSKVAVADLNGDGRYDFVIKQPEKNIDPAGTYWIPSPDTYKIEAYLSDGTFLWRHDLGWAIERGIWYSPYIVCDLTGDGKAEVAAKIGEGDPRDADGRVHTGPEWMVVWDGMTGKEIARVPWPDRSGFSAYSRMARNQMAVAYLDGKTPCLLALRGTYCRMKVDAYQLRDGKLELLWQYDNNNLPGPYWGQGAHFTRAIDVDGDGRDEVLLGNVMLDDNGVPLWTLGMGHDDFSYVGDIDPHRPGLEIFYGIESRAEKNGMCLVDAATGKVLWGFDEPTRHIHGAGMCADIDPTVPGLECFGLDCVSKRPDVRNGPWLWAADGTLLWYDQPLLPKTYSLTAVYWDADLQKELLLRGKLSDYAGGTVQNMPARPVAIADVLGDWREEIIASFPGEIRIYTTTIPAADRRVCLLQDRIYRADARMNSMGYFKSPMTSYCLEARSPGLNLTAMKDDAGKPCCRVVVSAPLDAGVSGTVQLEAGEGIKLVPDRFVVDVKPGRREIRFIEIDAGSKPAPPGLIKAALSMKDRVLRGQVPIGH